MDDESPEYVEVRRRRSAAIALVLSRADPFAIPLKLGECADRLYETRQKRLALDKKVKELVRFENDLREEIIHNLPKSNATGIAGKLARVRVETEEVPTLEDEDIFRGYMDTNQRHDLAYKVRPSSVAVREMWERGERVPGVGKFKRVKVLMSKV